MWDWQFVSFKYFYNVIRDIPVIALVISLKLTVKKRKNRLRHWTLDSREYCYPSYFQLHINRIYTMLQFQPKAAIILFLFLSLLSIFR